MNPERQKEDCARTILVDSTAGGPDILLEATFSAREQIQEDVARAATEITPEEEELEQS